MYTRTPSRSISGEFQNLNHLLLQKSTNDFLALVYFIAMVRQIFHVSDNSTASCQPGIG